MTTLSLRPAYLWLLLVPLPLFMYLAGQRVETAGVALGGVLALAAAVLPRHRTTLSIAVAVILLSLVSSLGLHLLYDDFHYRYVWLYSAAELTPYFKVANIWGGEEGTLLFCAALFALTAVALDRYGGWASICQLVFTAFFAFAAVAWDPFQAATEPGMNGRGMNVHLMKVWMTLHPPLIFIAYALVLAPAGAALQALATGESAAWREISHRHARTGWWLLSTGIGFGMWWAYEDFTFGQVWHWDPVQTSVFVVWAFCTAVLHGIRRYGWGGLFAKSLPLLSLLAGVSVFASMAVTRNQWLASSHRYIGKTSASWLVAMALLLLVASVVAWGRSLPRHSRTYLKGEPIWMIRIAITAFAVIAVVATVGLGSALVNAWLEAPRPDAAKPFFETLARWSSADELGALKEVFDRWDVDNFALNRWLAPLVAISMLIGGHAFLKLRNRRLAWSITASVAVAVGLVAFQWNPLDRFYHGTGVTSQQTVKNFFWLNVLLLSALYFAVSAIAWGVRSFTGASGSTIYRLCIGCIHGGAVLGLIAVVTATVLDSYAQSVFSYPEDFNTPKRFPDGYTVTIDLEAEPYQADGGRGAPAGAFRAVSAVDLKIQHAGEPPQTIGGEVLYRNEQAPLAAGGGPVRQLCQILDYRYARYVSSPAYMVDPLIHRGVLRDTQLWVSPVYVTNETDDGRRTDPLQATVVVRTFPLLSWLWVGLVMILIPALALTFLAWMGSRHSAPMQRE